MVAHPRPRLRLVAGLVALLAAAQALPEWRVTTPGFSWKPDGAGAYVFSREQAGGANGVAMRTVDAAPYRGKIVRMRARIRLERAGMGSAQMWLRVDREGGRMGFFDNMGDRPVRSNAAVSCEIAGPVAVDARAIAMGFLLFGNAQAIVEEISFAVAEDIPPLTIEPARPLTPRGLENVKAFARAYGYVRFFHPSVEARSMDWERTAVEGVRAIEGAVDAKDLALRLGKIFPATVRFSAGAEPAAPAPPAGELVRWVHHGFGGGQPGIYRSELAAVSGPAPEPLRADLGGGVQMAAAAAMPRGEAQAPARQAIYVAEDRATRLAGVIIAWNVFEHFYPYFDVAGADWPAELGKALERAARDADDAAFARTLRLLVAALRDGHGNVAGPGSAGMPLPLALAWADGRIVLRETGDTVVSIDGRPAQELLEDNSRVISGATPGWIRVKELGMLGAGPSASAARVEVEPFGKPGTREVRQVTRGAMPPAAKRPEKVTEIQPGVWYVDLTRISDADFTAALPQLGAAKGLVFDLRGYPRVSPLWLQHLSRTPLASAQWHVPAVTRPDHVDMPFTRMPGWNLVPLQPFLAARRAVLTDSSAISYAESTMGIVEHYKLAEIVGETTAGTNGNVNPFRLPGGYTVTWTGMKVLKHDGTRHHGVGIAPTIPVPLTRAALAEGRDEVLERAVAAVTAGQ